MDVVRCPRGYVTLACFAWLTSQGALGRGGRVAELVVAYAEAEADAVLALLDGAQPPSVEDR